MTSNIFIYLILCIFFIHGTQLLIENSTDIELLKNENVSHRKDRFFPFYSVVRFENSICTGTCLLTGTCYTRKECKIYGGQPSGTCAKRLGVCCIVQKSCGGSSHVNNTYFQNPGFPNPYIGSNRCTMTITRCDPNICQLRLDFLSLDLAQPNQEGVCDTDSLVVTGGASRVPIICGENSGQHVYVDFDGDEPIQISVRTNSGASSITRSWNIKATQIACDCPTKAPSGCLMYYTGVSGTVKSFNYGQTVSTTNGAVGTRQLVNNNYGVCIEMSPNFCSIQWSESETNSFVVSGDAALGNVASFQCSYDFVVIPNMMLQDVTCGDGVPPTSDRVCGTRFCTANSTSKPFVLYVVTDGTEQEADGTDTSNLGFSLDYKQIPCSD